MEKEMLDGLFWLPAEFLNDDDYDACKAGKPNSTGFGFGFGTGLSSPVESVVGSTESDEEEYLNELTQKLAQSTLEDNFYEPETKSTRVVVGSPQSTLCGWKQSSSRGSPKCVSPAPPPPLSYDNGAALDVLYAAAGEVARMKMTSYNRNVSQQPRKAPSYNLQFHQIQTAQKQIMMKKQRQQYYQMVQQSRVMNGGGNMKAAPVAAPLSAWPTLQQAQQQPPGSGMRAVFLGNPNPKRECIGTGVFLPRQVGAPMEPRKKRGCSTVLLPDKVVQALNLNLQAQPRSDGRRAPYDYEAQMRYNNVMMAEQQRQQAELDHLLPQEWTY